MGSAGTRAFRLFYMSKENNHSEEDILEAVMKSPFASLNDEEIHRFLKLCTFKSYKSGECVRFPDDPEREMTMVIKGIVTIYNVDKTRIMAQFEPGDCLGMMSLLFPIHKATRAYATDEDNLVLVFSEENFRKIGEIDPKLAMSIMRRIIDFMTPYVEAAANAMAEL